MTSTVFSGTAARSAGSWPLVWLVGLSISGYPVVAVVITLLGVGSTVLSYPFRAVVVLLAGLCVAEVIRRQQPFRFELGLLLFWWLYSLRFAFDLQNPAYENTLRDLIFFVSTVLVPSVASMLMAQRYDQTRLARMLFYLGAVTSVGSLFLFLTGRVSQELIVGQGGRAQLDVLNAITLAHVGVTGLIAALVLWSQHRSVLGGRIGLLIGSVVTFVAVFMSGSRGPLLALAAAVAAFLVVRGRWGQILAAAVVMGALLPGVIASHGLTVLNRLTDIYLDTSAQERLVYQQAAIDQALASPFFGNAYVEVLSDHYPHNLIIESAMALGLGGLALFVFLCGKGIVTAAQKLRTGETLLPLLFIQYLVAVQFSSSLWGAASFWITLSLILTYRSSYAQISTSENV